MGKEKIKLAKKVLSGIVALSMTAMLTPAVAFADIGGQTVDATNTSAEKTFDDNIKPDGRGLNVNADNGSATVTVNGSIDSDLEGTFISGDHNSNANVTAKDVKANDNAVAIYASNGSTARVDVDSVTSTSGGGTGIITRADEDSTVTVNVKNDVESKSDGLWLRGDKNGAISISRSNTRLSSLTTTATCCKAGRWNTATCPPTRAQLPQRQKTTNTPTSSLAGRPRSTR